MTTLIKTAFFGKEKVRGKHILSIISDVDREHPGFAKSEIGVNMADAGRSHPRAVFAQGKGAKRRVREQYVQMHYWNTGLDSYAKKHKLHEHEVGRLIDKSGVGHEDVPYTRLHEHMHRAMDRVRGA